MTESASLIASAAAIPVSTPPTSSNGVFNQMKLSVSREAFLARLGVAARGVSTRSSIQTLSGVRIGGGGGGRRRRVAGDRHGDRDSREGRRGGGARRAAGCAAGPASARRRSFASER